jgi:hypothetical protein
MEIKELHDACGRVAARVRRYSPPARGVAVHAPGARWFRLLERLPPKSK